MPVCPTTVQVKLLVDASHYDNFYCNTSLTVAQFVHTTSQSLGLAQVASVSVNGTMVPFDAPLHQFAINSGTIIEFKTSVGGGSIPAPTSNIQQADDAPSAPNLYPSLQPYSPQQANFEYPYAQQQQYQQMPYQQPAYPYAMPYVQPQPMPYSYAQPPVQPYPVQPVVQQPPVQLAPMPKPTKGLLQAVQDQDLACVQAHVQHASNLNIVDNENRTPLYHACANGNFAIVHALIEGTSIITMLTHNRRR